MTALRLFLDVLGAPLHAPVLRWNLLAALARPLDGGRRWRGIAAVHAVLNVVGWRSARGPRRCRFAP